MIQVRIDQSGNKRGKKVQDIFQEGNAVSIKLIPCIHLCLSFKINKLPYVMYKSRQFIYGEVLIYFTSSNGSETNDLFPVVLHNN